MNREIRVLEDRMKKVLLVCAALIALSTSSSAFAQGAPPAAAPEPSQVAETAVPETRSATETICNDRRDQDGDSLVDCADSDCFHDAACESGDANENTNDRCSDWIDNDGDGSIDCDDTDCEGNGVTRCNGTWSGRGTEGEGVAAQPMDIPELSGNQQIEDLLGRGGDSDGERTDEVCADGIDNDNDGRTDCQDMGCRFDPSVTVCSTSPGLRFSAVVMAGAQFNMSEQSSGLRPDPTLDASFSRIQLRALGQMPFIPGSFFLINARAERDIRLTFAMFQMPVGQDHYVNINTGGGALSSQLIQSVARNPFGDPVNFAFNFAEQRAGLALEFGGPVALEGAIRYRLFGAIGAGTLGGSVGGEFFRFEGGNTTFGAGGQLQFNILGRYDRFSSPMLYTPVPTTLALYLGARFDQRPAEQYIASNAFAVFRTGPIHLSAEAYVKREFAFESWQSSYVLNANALIVPRRLLLSAEFAQFIGTNLESAIASGETLARPVDQWQIRAAAHVYIFRNIFLGSLIFRENHRGKNPTSLADNIMERTVELEARFLF